MGQPFLISNRGSSKIGVENDGGMFGGNESIGQFLFPTGRRLKMAKSFVIGSMLGSLFLALMASALKEASTIRAWIASTSKFGLGG
jgi:hypothetical protein